MSRSIMKSIVALMSVLIIIGCGPEAEVGYQPPLVPVKISVNTNGDIKVKLSGSYATPVGTFFVGGGVTVASLREEYTNRVLLIRVDDEALVYELEDGKKFDVVFEDENTLYKKVAFIHEANGDIVLELVTVNGSNPPPIVEPPITENDRQVPDPEGFLYDYFYDVVNRRNYEYLWTLSSDRFKQANSDGDYQDFVSFWNTVDNVSVHSLSCTRPSTYKAICDINMTWTIKGNDTVLAVDYDLFYDSDKSTWIFE